MFSNIMGLVSTGVTSVALYFYVGTVLNQRLWAASIAVAATLVPGLFITSLYGYPSVYSLPFLVIAATMFLKAFKEADARKARALLLAGTLAYLTAALLKLDFAMMGTWFLAPLIGMGGVVNRARIAWQLIGVAVITAAVGLFMSSSVVWGESPQAFVESWNRTWAPFRSGIDIASIGYCTGFGTLGLLLLVFVHRIVRRGLREGGSLAMSWLLAVAPLWLFWALIPPLSTRHCLPGALVTAVYLGVAVAQANPRRRILAFMWPIVLVAVNWAWVEPGFKINYRLSGNLAGAYNANRNVYEACRGIVGDIVARDKNVLIMIRSLQPGQRKPRDRSYLLDAIDIQPMMKYELARNSVYLTERIEQSAVQASSRSSQRAIRGLKAQYGDGSERVVIDGRNMMAEFFFRALKYPRSDYLFYSLEPLNEHDVKNLERRGIPHKVFDLQERYEQVLNSGR
jgi:hypothetical protein